MLFVIRKYDPGLFHLAPLKNIEHGQLTNQIIDQTPINQIPIKTVF